MSIRKDICSAYVTSPKYSCSFPFNLTGHAKFLCLISNLNVEVDGMGPYVN